PRRRRRADAELAVQMNVGHHGNARDVVEPAHPIDGAFDGVIDGLAQPPLDRHAHRAPPFAATGTNESDGARLREIDWATACRNRGAASSTRDIYSTIDAPTSGGTINSTSRWPAFGAGVTSPTDISATSPSSARE